MDIGYTAAKRHISGLFGIIEKVEILEMHVDDAAAQQVHGAVAQGLGYALSEQLLLRDGEILNPNFATYLLPTSLDLPDMAALAVETVETTGPFGMKGIGEVGTNAPLPAVANAIRDALGHDPCRSPLTGEHILALVGEGPGKETKWLQE